MTDAKESRWIEFGKPVESESGKTFLWTVMPKHGDILIGRIKWFGPWRCYALFPSPATVFERVCLRDIADFCEARTKEHLRQKEIETLEAPSAQVEIGSMRLGGRMTAEIIRDRLAALREEGEK
jgi:hypothetical protein